MEQDTQNIAQLFKRLGVDPPGTDIDMAVVFALLELEERREQVKELQDACDRYYHRLST